MGSLEIQQKKADEVPLEKGRSLGQGMGRVVALPLLKSSSLC